MDSCEYKGKEMKTLANGYTFFETLGELESAFYTAYPQHKPNNFTNESSIDWTDWFDSMCRMQRVHHSLIGE